MFLISSVCIIVYSTEMMTSWTVIALVVVMVVVAVMVIAVVIIIILLMYCLIMFKKTRYAYVSYIIVHVTTCLLVCFMVFNSSFQ